MKGTKRKGFTIVELVIVIAVVAILAAVLIPTFSGIIEKANRSTDMQLVKNLNTALQVELNSQGVAGEYLFDTAYDAVCVCAANGYLVNTIVAKSSYDIAYCMSEGKFVLVNTETGEIAFPTGDEVQVSSAEGKEADYFIFRSSVPTGENEKKYSLFAGDGWTAETVNIEGVGFDAGYRTEIKTVNYTNSGEGATAKKVVIRTNSFETALAINAPEDTIEHYGNVGHVNITAVADHSYIEYGNGAIVQVTDGHIKITKNADIAYIHITKKTESAFDEIEITIEDGAKLPQLSRDSVSISDGETVKVCTVTATGKSEDVILAKKGIVEQVQLINNTESRYAAYEKEPYENQDDKQNSAANMLANDLNGMVRNEEGKIVAMPATVKEDGTEEIKAQIKIEFDYATREFVVVVQSGTLNENEKKEQIDLLVQDGGKNISEIATTVASPLYSDVWDGTADTSWYDDAKNEFEIVTAEQLAGLAELVNSGKTFEGKTVKLGKDIDLKTDEENPKEWKQIGNVYGSYSPLKPFMGVFDGQNHIISGIYQNCYDDNGHNDSDANGLFGCVKNGTVKNLIIADEWIGTETDNQYGAFGVGGFVGTAFGNCVFDTLTLKDSYLCGYQCSIGGIVGGCTSGNMTFNNINVDNTNILTPWNWGCWSSCDCQIGGIIGAIDIQDNYSDAEHANKNGLYTTHVTLSNCTVACQLMQMNDVCSNYWWYQYRSSGMLIGGFTHNCSDGLWNNADNVTDAMLQNALTCNNVKVVYDTWNHQIYCYGEGLGRSGGEGFSRVDDISEHNHKSGMEDICLVFDQLIGGWSGGTWRHETGNNFEAYAGVNVTYLNNSQPED